MYRALLVFENSARMMLVLPLYPPNIFLIPVAIRSNIPGKMNHHSFIFDFYVVWEHSNVPLESSWWWGRVVR